MKRQTTLLQAVIVLGGFLALAFLCNQSGIEIHLALFAAWFLAMAVGKRNGFSYQEMEHAVTKGIYDGMSAILILLAVGALVGTWISGGIVPSLIYYGLKVIHPSIFLLATLILCSITSIATGTSWGTVGTSGIAMMGIGSALGIPAPITAEPYCPVLISVTSFHRFQTAAYCLRQWRILMLLTMYAVFCRYH